MKLFSYAFWKSFYNYHFPIDQIKRLKRNHIWSIVYFMERVLFKLEKLGMLTIPALILLTLVSPLVFELWLGNGVKTSIYISGAFAFYVFCKIMGNIYMFQINGTGKVRIQLITYSIIAVLAIPIMIYSCRLWGLIGIVVVPSLAFFIQFIISRIQLKRIINRTAKGIWNK